MDYFTKIYFRPFYIYRDEESIEKTTGIQKTKYKLFWNFLKNIEEVLLFLVSTTNKDAVSKELYFSVHSTEWKENIEPMKFLTKTSYISIKKIEVENIEELIEKRKKNIFYCVAKLPDTKFAEVSKCYKNFIQKVNDLSPSDKSNLSKLTDCLPRQICIDSTIQNFINTYLQ